MAVLQVQVRRGAYYDSVVLMQLQRSLASLPGVIDAGVIMGTEANKEILAQSDLLAPEARAAAADDLLIVVKATGNSAAGAALGQVDDLLVRRRHGQIEQEFLPKSVESACQVLPSARWVLISVAGRYAAGVARQALQLGRNVFLYSDNVSVEDEVSLKHTAGDMGLLVMGPDCGTAIVNGVGLGFANRVRRGPIGIVAASGTGLQLVSSRIHQLGSGITHALGTGGRDLSEAVGGATALQAIDLLGRDPETKVVVVVSKPPAPRVAEEVLAAAVASGKPVIIELIGFRGRRAYGGGIFFANTLDEVAELAVDLAAADELQTPEQDRGHFAAGQAYLRGLFSGGTLAYETLLILLEYLPQVYSNIAVDGSLRLGNATLSRAHTIVDLGDDELTVGRLHPMMDNDLRIRRLQQEADDPGTAVVLLDVVLGYGAHPDPAGELAPAISAAIAKAAAAGRHLLVIAVVVGTDEDPQDMEAQMQLLRKAGACVYTSNAEAARHAGSVARALRPTMTDPEAAGRVPVPLEVITAPLEAVNVGLDSFSYSLRAQDAAVIQVDWRPPAGGDEKLMALLERMRRNAV